MNERELRIMPPDRDVFFDRAHALANEIASAFRDIEHWNHAHPDHVAIDPDPDGELRGLHNRLIRFLRTEEKARARRALQGGGE